MIVFYLLSGIPIEDLSKMREEFLAHDQHKLAQDMCHYHSIRDLTLSPRALLSNQPCVQYQGNVHLNHIDIEDKALALNFHKILNIS